MKRYTCSPIWGMEENPEGEYVLYQAFDAAQDLRAYGEGMHTTAIHFRDKDSYQFWAGWLAALDRVHPRFPI